MIPVSPTSRAGTGMEDFTQPYGPLVETTLRVITWNVWGRYGPWERREEAVRETLAKHDPDIVALVEGWGGQEQRFGMRHHVFGGDVMVDGVPAGIAVLSRWPIARREWRRFHGSGETGGD